MPSAKQYYLEKLKLWSTGALMEVDDVYSNKLTIKEYFAHLLHNTSDELPLEEYNNIIESYNRAKETVRKQEVRRNWLRRILDVKEVQRSRLTCRPTWSFAGDLDKRASDIMTLVSNTVSTGNGTKDDLPFVYVSNPPRHGKSLLLDKLFEFDGNVVCVLNVTYNASTTIHDEELKSPNGAVCGFLLRLVHDLIGGSRWEDLWDNSPFINKSLTEMLHNFETMLGLPQSERKLLICIDEVSKLTDHEKNVWSTSKETNAKFWRALYSLTRACSSWIRIVMTGFTDSPRNAVIASDVACQAYSLSMITNSEQETLCHELLWAYAANNKKFPGLLWVLTKSTPGLLGLWAQQINLHSNIRNATLDRAMDLSQNFEQAASAVAWVKNLSLNAIEKWEYVRAFLVQDMVHCSRSLDTEKKARNAEVATMLGGKQALSPFAVAVVVMSLRSNSLVANDCVFQFLSDALGSCERHSAGCAADCSIPWPTTVQRALISKAVKSDILDGDVNLKSAPTDILQNGTLPDCVTGATVQNIGKPMKDFVTYAIALRFQCLLEYHTPCEARLSDILPPSVGCMKRCPRPCGKPSHHLELNIAVSVCRNPDVDIARLCTQTAALLLPSSISSILNGFAIDKTISASAYFQPNCILNLNDVEIRFKKVEVVSPQLSPQIFPVVMINPKNNVALHGQLVDAMSQMNFSPESFCRTFPNALQRDVVSVYDSVKKVVSLVKKAAQSQAVLLFQPQSGANALCDTVIIVPTASSSVSIIMLELRDHVNSAFGEKLQKMTNKELMLGPVAEAAKRVHVQVDHVIYALCGRNVIQVQV